MKFLFVIAHPDTGNSLNHKIVDVAKKHLEKNGHEVKVSDLFQMDWGIGGKKDFKKLTNPKLFDFVIEQKHGMQKDNFVEHVKKEIEKIKWAEVIILQFPLYWWSFPGVMKCYIDTCFCNYHAYGGGNSLKKPMMFSCVMGGNYVKDFDVYFAGIFGEGYEYCEIKKIKSYLVPDITHELNESGDKKFKSFAERSEYFASGITKHLDTYLLGEKIIYDDSERVIDKIKRLEKENEELKKKVAELQK